MRDALGVTLNAAGDRVYDPEKLQDFKDAVWRRFHSLECGSMIADPLKVFVKTEPHNLKKLADGRYRLISGVSLVDTMIDRILFSWLSRAVLEKSGKTPVRVGWDVSGGGWRELYNYFAGQTVTCIDKSSWDWTMQPWVSHALLHVIKQLMFNAPEWHVRMIESRFRLLFGLAIFRFSDGTQVKQVGTGIMKSGCYMTIIFNSIAQILLHVGATLRMGGDPQEGMPECLGDDTVQTTPKDLREYVTHLEKLGCKVKGVKLSSFIEFAGMQITSDRVIPSYWKKHMFRLRHHKDESFGEFCEAMQILYAHSPNAVEIFRSALVRKGLPQYLVSPRRAKAIMG